MDKPVQTMNNNTPYTIVTGASGGLGTCFTLECAAQGRNLVLIDLPNRKLARLCEFLERNFPIRAKGLEIDLTKDGAAEKVAEEIRKDGLGVSMLINNAGLSQNEIFEQTDARYMRKMVEVNCISIFTLIHELLPDLKSQPQSAILNVSSLAGFFPLPRKTCYSASKAFVRQYSQALRLELSGTGVSVSVLCPGAMTTNIDNYVLHRQLNWFSQQMVIHPKHVAQMALRGAQRGKEIIIPGRLNRFIFSASAAVPGFIKRALLKFSMKQLRAKAQNPVAVPGMNSAPAENLQPILEPLPSARP